MRRAVLLSVFTVLILFAAGSCCLAGSYQGVCGIPFTGAGTDRGMSVNRNPASPFYGYFYGIDSASGAVRIWKPDSGGTAAASYTNTGNKLSYATTPSGSLFMHVFVGEDDTVWVADYGAKKIVTGPANGAATGGNLTEQGIVLSYKPRGIFVVGRLGEAGTRVYVAEYESATAKACEVFKYDGAAWTREADLTSAVNLTNPWFVWVDSQGNSYWGNSSKTPPLVRRIKADFSVDSAWTLAKPSFLGSSWTVGGIAFVEDPSDLSHPKYLYVSAYNQTSCVRFDENGNYIDGYGNTAGMAGTPPAGTWTSMAFSGPGGNSTVWVAADDQHNTYVLVTYPGATPQAYKVHLQSAPKPPSNLSASNDIYGQIRLSWSAPVASTEDPTSYRIYRSIDTSKPAVSYGEVSDAYTRWKDSIQGQSAGAFYYWVASVNGAGESAAVGPIGPVSVGTSSAPTPLSKGLALSYSEINKADTANNPSYDRDWEIVESFLKDRAVSFTKEYDADSAYPNIENDDIAGYSLLFLGTNRDMTSYTAQCIRDYVKYSEGRVLSSYVNSIANGRGIRQSNYLLSDVYRANALNLINGAPFFSDATSVHYRFLLPVPTAPEASAIFAGLGSTDPLWGAQQYNCIGYLIQEYTDGTASAVGKWYDSDRTTQSQADPNDAGLVVGYRDSSKSRIQSVFTGSNWWTQALGSFSAAKVLENILAIFGFTCTPPTTGISIGALKQKSDKSSALVYSKVITRKSLQSQYNVGMGTDIFPVFYIEDTDRSGGIKVASGVDVIEGAICSVAGIIETKYGERQITATEIIQLGEASPQIRPVYLTGRNVAGVGLDCTGMLVTVSGAMTEAWGMDNNGNNFFRLNDGSDKLYGSATAAGIKVLGLPPDGAAIGSLVQATGVVGAEMDGTTVIPVVRLRLYEQGSLIKP